MWVYHIICRWLTICIFNLFDPVHTPFLSEFQQWRNKLIRFHQCLWNQYVPLLFILTSLLNATSYSRCVFISGASIPRLQLLVPYQIRNLQLWNVQVHYLQNIIWSIYYDSIIIHSPTSGTDYYGCALSLSYCSIPFFTYWIKVPAHF